MFSNTDQAPTIFEHYVKCFTSNLLYSHRIPIDDKSEAYSYIAERVYSRTFTVSYKFFFLTSFYQDLLICQSKSMYVKIL